MQLVEPRGMYLNNSDGKRREKGIVGKLIEESSTKGIHDKKSSGGRR